MRLQLMTWLEVKAYLAHSDAIILPVGSTEQHGPIGLVGTDALCAGILAEKAADLSGTMVAPTLALTPAPFNMAFPGTMSVSEPLFRALVAELVAGLTGQGFRHLYFLNAHGANLAPLHAVAESTKGADIRIRSWWDFDAVNVLRHALYGDWEGMHATPSEVAITQAVHRIVPPHPLAEEPPEKLTADFLRAHAGDRHGAPDAHRAAFPDGRVGSHSALARPEDGARLIEVAVAAIAADIKDFCTRKAVVKPAATGVSPVN